MSDYKNILITVAGSTPQILTETLYDLIVQRKMVISQMVIITTLHGQKTFDEKLFNNGEGYFYRFCAEYGLKAREIHITYNIIENKNGEKLNDIRTEEENKAAADFIMRIVRHYSQDANVCILASIAGGRKTMSTYMGFAMLFYGRKQDKLFHVLVAPQELESNPLFFYPSKGKQDLVLETRTKDKVTIPYKNIKVTNAEISFIRLRDFLPFINGPAELTYDDLVALTQEEMKNVFAPTVELYPDRSTVLIQWRSQKWPIKLKPMDFAFYVYLWEKQSIVNSADAPHAKAIQQIYHKIRPGAEASPSFEQKDLTDSRARINRLINETIRYEQIAQFLLIQSQQHHRIPTYSIGLPKIHPSKPRTVK